MSKNEADDSSSEIEEPVVKRRGRPRKEKVEKPKRPVGRPRTRPIGPKKPYTGGRKPKALNKNNKYVLYRRENVDSDWVKDDVLYKTLPDIADVLNISINQVGNLFNRKRSPTPIWDLYRIEKMKQ